MAKFSELLKEYLCVQAIVNSSDGDEYDMRSFSVEKKRLEWLEKEMDALIFNKTRF